MTRRNEASRQPRATRLSGEDPADWITFVSDGEERRVDLRAPRPNRRGERTFVHLMDLWVATLLPGDFLDLKFEIVTTDANGRTACSGPIEALTFSRGYLEIETRTLSWDDPADHPLNGHRAVSIVVLRAVSAPQLAASKPQVHQAKPQVHRIASVADLQRLLPHVPRVYPRVVLRMFPLDEAPRRAG